MTPATAATSPFDFDQLLSPISADQPAGAELRYEAVYDQLRDLRREDDATLPQGVWKSEQKKADWRAVESLCLETLKTKSKDLQIAAWLLEAWVHLYGFEGAAQGFRLMNSLCAGFWDNLHPTIEGDDADFRIAPLVWLNRKLPTDLKLLPLTAPQGDGIPACTLADWETAAPSAGSQNKSSQAPGPAREMTLARFRESAARTPAPQLGMVADCIRGMLHQCGELEGLLDRKLGRESPGFPSIRGVGDTALALIEALLHERPNDQPAESTEAAGPSQSDESKSDQSTPDQSKAESAEESSALYASSRIRTRSEAYRWLGEAADFLERTEPHSPSSYLVRRAITWGSMSLQELLGELVRNPGELTEIYRMLNVRPPDSGKK
jgi:type VI secretion system protein ImpA